MRLLVSLALTTLLASAFAQEVPAAQIEAVNELPNVDVQLVDENTFTAGDVAEETAAVADPSSVIVSAINDAVETVAATLDASVAEDDSVALELDSTAGEEPALALEVAEEEPVVVTEVVEEDLAPALEVADEEEAAIVDEVVEDESAPTLEVAEEEEPAVVDEVVEDDAAPTLEVAEDEAPEVEEILPEDEPMLQAPVASETAAPDPAAEMEEDDSETPTLTVADPEPVPEPTDTETQGDEKFAAEAEPVEPVEEVIDVVEIEEPREPTKKELKAVEKFNAAVDSITKILSQRLSERDALPLDVDEEVLDELEREVTTLPPTTTSTTTEAPTTAAPAECPAKWVDKCLSEKCKTKANCLKKCNKKGCATEKKNKKNNKKNKNKKNRKEDKKTKNDKNDKKNNKNKNNKNKNKNNNNKNKKNNRVNRNKNIRNRLFRNSGSNRQSKGLDFEEEMVVEGRRKQEDSSAKIRNDKRRRGGNKKNKVDRVRSEDLPAEAKDKMVAKSAEPGPMFADLEEFAKSPAMILGFSKIRRDGDVVVDLSGRHAKFVAEVVMGPLTVLQTRPSSSEKRSEVTTELRAQMHFTAKEARKRNRLSINEVVVDIPEEVAVARFDLELEPEVVSAAQEGVSSAIDTDRLARILHQTLAAAFEEDNIMQNLEDHPALKAKALGFP